MVGELNGSLINTNNVLDYVRLQPPTFINIGGLKIAKEPISRDVESYVDDSSPHGAILFTMGFIFDPSVVPSHRIRSFFEVFGSLRQNIIVKFDVNKLPSNTHLTIPRNVMVLPFVPQVLYAICHRFVEKYLNIKGFKATFTLILKCVFGIYSQVYWATPM